MTPVVGGKFVQARCGALPAKQKNMRITDKTRRRAQKFCAPYEDVERRVVFERDNWECRHCGKDVRDRADHDHIIPLSKSGPHTYWNSQTLCVGCNRGINGKHDRLDREPLLAKFAHLFKNPRRLVEAFAKERGIEMPAGWWAKRLRQIRKAKQEAKCDSTAVSVSQVSAG